MSEDREFYKTRNHYRRMYEQYNDLFYYERFYNLKLIQLPTGYIKVMKDDKLLFTLNVGEKTFLVVRYLTDVPRMPYAQELTIEKLENLTERMLNEN